MSATKRAILFRTSIRAILAIALFGAFLALASNAFFIQGTEPQNGEWVGDTPLAATHLPSCTPNGCIEWCNYSANGLVPSGKLCCSDAAGKCIESTIFFP